jgi:deazaflavin-dependent oxidoreductase (nitroreductase family)
MTLTGEYEPSRRKWVRDQVERYEATGGREANTLAGTRRPVVIFTTRGAKSGKIRKFALMRVEHDGAYALVGSDGGAKRYPGWVHNLRAHPDQVLVQDGPEAFQATVRELTGEEREDWWRRAVDAYPPYEGYQRKTERLIPVFLAERRG